MITKFVKKKIMLLLLIPIIFIFLYAILIRILFLPRNPSEELARALAFEKDGDSIGMTYEECESILGELGEFPDNKVVIVPSGYYRYPGFFQDVTEYELYIYFDDNRCIKRVMLRTVYEG